MNDTETRLIKAAALKQYPPSKLIEDYDGDRYADDEWGYDECQRRAFIAGAEWQKSRSNTPTPPLFRRDETTGEFHAVLDGGDS